MAKKILVATLYESGAIYHAANLESAMQHWEQGHEVTFLNCRARNYFCEYNPKGNRMQCYVCKMQNRRGLKAFPSNVNHIFLDELLSTDDLKVIDSLSEEAIDKGIAEDTTYEEFDWGRGILSTMISRTRDNKLNLNEYPIETSNIARSSMGAYFALSNLFKNKRFDKVYLHNGRHAMLRAILRACEKFEIPYGTTEGGQDLRHYGVFENAMPHSISPKIAEINRLWNNATDEREAIGASFYKRKIVGNSTTAGTIQDYTGEQTSGMLPEDWDPKKHNVVIFNSSEDEYASIGDEWSLQFYDDQLDGINRIGQSLSKCDEHLRIYLRVHPNLKDVTNEFTRGISKLTNSKIIVIPAESKISSYELMFRCNTVLSFGSTIGIEAVYWNKPSILLGQSFYRLLGGTYTPDSHSQLMDLLCVPLKPKNRLPALIYGYYLMTFGKEYKHTIIRKTRQDITFRGVHLNGNWLIRSLLSIRRKLGGSSNPRAQRRAQKKAKKKLK